MKNEVIAFIISLLYIWIFKTLRATETKRPEEMMSN